MSSLLDSYARVAEGDRPRFVSEAFPVSGDIVLDVNSAWARCFAGVLYYAAIDEPFDSFLDPSGLTGNAVITAKTRNSPAGFQEVIDGTLDASQVNQANWAANTLQVKASFAAITGATHARLIVTCNRS